MSQRKINILIVLLVTLLFFVIFSDRIIHVNGPSQAAVIFRPFNGGLDTKHVYREGVFIIWPWNEFYKFDTKEQVVEKIAEIIVRNGVTVKMIINFRYRPDINKLPFIFRQYGINYGQIFVIPEVLSAVQQCISDYDPETLYTLALDSIRSQTFFAASQKASVGNVIVTNLHILHIELPPKVVDAIELKLQNEQMSLSWDYKKIIAEKEKEIKIIEAEGTRQATALINEGLSDKYLQYKQIEAFDKLSNSVNAKTIIVPRGTTTPLILNQNQ